MVGHGSERAGPWPLSPLPGVVRPQDPLGLVRPQSSSHPYRAFSIFYLSPDSQLPGEPPFPEVTSQDTLSSSILFYSALIVPDTASYIRG
jgi:hypothetical protein